METVNCTTERGTIKLGEEGGPKTKERKPKCKKLAADLNPGHAIRKDIAEETWLPAMPVL